MASIVENVDQDELNQQPQQSQVGSTIMPSAAPNQSATQQFNQQQQPQRQIGSGRFTNIQQYLGANKQAGQQLGQTLQKGIGQKFGQAQATAGRELGEAQQQQTATGGLYGQGIQQYQQLGGQKAIADVAAAPVQGAIQQQQYAPSMTAKPTTSLTSINQPSQNKLTQTTGGLPTFSGTSLVPTRQEMVQEEIRPTVMAQTPTGTLASEYTANIGSRQQAASDIAKNQEALQQFLGLRSGTAQTQQEALVRKQAEEARQTAEALKQQYEQRTQQLASETGRSGLLGEFVGGRDYTGAKRSLDLAFLQKDPNRALDALRQNIGARQGEVQTGLGKVGEVETQEGLLRTRGQELSKSLTEQTGQNVADYVSNLESRIGVMEQQRGQKMDWARKQLEDFKGGKPLSQDFLDLVDVKQGTQLFNVPKELTDLGQFLDVGDFNRQLNIQDVANQQDIANYAALAQLAGLTSGEFQFTEASKLKDISQYGPQDERTLSARTQKAKEDFLRNAANQIISGTTSWVGGQQGQASQNLLDFLTGGTNIGKEVRSNTGDFSRSSIPGLISQGGQLATQLGSLIDPTGLVSPGVNQAAQQVAGAIAAEGGDIEKGLHGLTEIAALPTTLLPGDLGEMGRNVTGAIQDLISGISGIGDTRDTAADIAKDVGYASQRSESYLRNALADYLQNAGFYNYMGDTSSASINPYTIGAWDNNVWRDPSQDLAAFGYGNSMLLPGATPGIYRPTTQTTTTQGPLTNRDEILRRLASTGTLDNLERMPQVG